MEKIIKTNGLYYGLVLGFLLIFPVLLGYTVNISFLISYWTVGYNFIVVILLGILAIVFTRKALGGFINFKKAFTTYFIVILTSFILSFLFKALLFNVIDKNFSEIVKKEQIEFIYSQRDWVVSKLGQSPQEDIDELYDKYDEEVEKIQSSEPNNFEELAKQLLASIAIFLLIGLIISLILKKKEPEFN